MNDILNIYLRSMTVEKLSDVLTQNKIVHCSLGGGCGSVKAIVATAVFLNTKTTHLCVLPDREAAAFFYSDVEQLLEEENKDVDNRQTVFLPDVNKDKIGRLSTDFDVLLRIKALQKIRQGQPLLVVTYPEALVGKVVNEQEARLQTRTITLGEEISMDELIEFLNEKGFEYNDFVVQAGNFALRGSLIDVFSYAGEHPYRIELNGDIVASLRTFDVETQLTKTLLDQIVITPNLQEGGEGFERISILKSLPLESVIWFEDYAQTLQRIAKVNDDWKANNPDFSPSSNRFITKKEFEEETKTFSTVEMSTRGILKTETSLQLKTQPQQSVNKQFSMLVEQWFENYQRGIRNVFCSVNDNQVARIRNIVRDMFKNHELFADYSDEYLKELEHHLVTYNRITLHEGFMDEEHQIACYTDHQLFERYHRYKVEDRYRKSETVMLKDIYELRPGDFVTHIDHGIGRYAGLEKIDVNGKQQEAIKIIYKENDILYISIHSMHRIAKYAGKDGIEPTLTRLGGNAWSKIKERTKRKVKELVIDLAKLYAERKIKAGYAFSGDNFMQNELEASFLYEDTPDQLKATADVKSDMESSQPMDRLICGDVGFGKTEIAIRAAFKAVCDNKQVAVLVPTTILALQHYNTFSDRLANFPCQVDYINRFRNIGEQKKILENVRTGKTDIIIGTHRLLGMDIQFKDLGLIIVDEEQKFGVGAKEKLRSLQVNVDTMTMTATPIPRTLQFSLIGARDISIMKTPPLNRYPIETNLCQFSETFVKEAIGYELSRGGQVFFVHNRVHNIAEIAGMVERNFPDSKVAIAHGQMPGNVLERTMLNFMDGVYDVLVCTTIIESGLDIPNANTIIINDAQNFGLSELHQLRGRVGRKNKKAFCYLLTPSMELLSELSRKRLRAIEEYSDIGSGLNIAMRDLDIRGAGDLLGAQQSGFISEIGYEMYEKILQEAIFELQQLEADIETNPNTDIEFVKDCVFETDLELLIPDSYVSSHLERYQLYKELSSLTSEEELQAFGKRLIDRFGKIPVQTKELIKTITLRNMGKRLGAEKLALKQNCLVCYFPTNEESPYYRSLQFAFLLDVLQQNPSLGQVREHNHKLTLSFFEIHSVDKALERVGKFVRSEH